MLRNENAMSRASKSGLRRRSLTSGQAREVRLSMESTGDIAVRLGVSVKVISGIRRGKTYGLMAPDERRAKDRRDGITDEYFLADHLLMFGHRFRPSGLHDQDCQEARDAAYECRAHGRLAGDRTPACGCFAGEPAVIVELPVLIIPELEVAA